MSICRKRKAYTLEEIDYVWNNQNRHSKEFLAYKIGRSKWSVREILYRKRLELDIAEKRKKLELHPIPSLEYVSRIHEPCLNILPIGSTVKYQKKEWEVLEDFGQTILITTRDYKSRLIIDKTEL